MQPYICDLYREDGMHGNERYLILPVLGSDPTGSDPARHASYGEDVSFGLFPAAAPRPLSGHPIQVTPIDIEQDLDRVRLQDGCMCSSLL